MNYGLVAYHMPNEGVMNYGLVAYHMPNEGVMNYGPYKRFYFHIRCIYTYKYS